MPVITERIERGIYENRWVGVVTLEEIFTAKDKLEVLAQEDNCDKFIVVICGREATRYPITMVDLRNTVPKGIQELIVYQAPSIGELLLKTLKPLFPITITTYRNADDALNHARVSFAKIDNQ